MMALLFWRREGIKNEDGSVNVTLKSLTRSYDVISSAISLVSFLAGLVGENGRL